MVTEKLQSELWVLHKGIRNKFLLRLCKCLQRQWLNKQKLINDYHIFILNEQASVKYITSTRTITTTLFNRNLVREFIINHRSRYGTKKADKLFNNYVKYVASKEIKHSSDVAIAYNIIKNIPTMYEQKIYLVNHMIECLGDKVPAYIKKLGDDKIYLKSYMLSDIIKELKIVTQ